MNTFFRYLKADFQKTKRTPIRIAHLLIPVCTAVVFLAYYSFASWTVYEKIDGYYQILGVAFPFLISLFCVLISEQELAAGRFQGILAVSKKQMFIYSKLILLIAFGGFAVLLASVLFGMGYHFLLHQDIVDYDFYIEIALLLLISNVPIYMLHLFLSFRFNKGVSIGLGMVESLISVLLLTGLGEYIWIYVPCTWSSRLATQFLEASSLNHVSEKNFSIVILLCFFSIVLGLVALGIWYRNWEGKTGND